ncbi:UNVERIFIED_CONTAM: hypothetical protein PYX00_000781 [Menopon gallinae]|uniref:Uncharacterized protein n=1 Tax=Menopon gallinae TaxID=328185 RepID=A0AAW2IBN8_9NEOP
MFCKLTVFLAVALCLIGSLVLAYPSADPGRYHGGGYHHHHHWGGGHLGFGGHHGGWGHHGWSGGYLGFRPPRPHLYG